LLEDVGPLDLSGIHWVIVGGESGAGARPMQKEWVLSIRDQCRAAHVPFFFKQWGGVRKGKTGRAIDGVTYNKMPERTQTAMLPRERRLKLADEIECWFTSNSKTAAIQLFGNCVLVVGDGVVA
jgi:hypothetical protein